jgi:endonuclease/exonuclease/phosphatase (EEP) superfamily protein YafD
VPHLKPSRAGLAFRARVIALCALAALGLPWLVPLSERLPPPVAWGLDLAVHWQLAAAALLGVTVLAWAWLSGRPAVLVLWLGCALPWVSGGPRLEPGSPDRVHLRVATANVKVDNAHPQRVLDWLELSKVEVAVLHEVSPALATAIELQAYYPYRFVHASEDPFGMAVLSKFPLHASVRVANEDGAEVVDAVLVWQGRNVALTALHPMPPVAARYVRLRDALIETETRRLNDMGMPGLLAGDLNASPWSSAFAAPQSLGWRRTGSLAGTWPSTTGGALGISIDHVLASPHWALAGFERGPDIGSDHRPVLVQLQLRDDAAGQTGGHAVGRRH